MEISRDAGSIPAASTPAKLCQNLTNDAKPCHQQGLAHSGAQCTDCQIATENDSQRHSIHSQITPSEQPSSGPTIIPPDGRIPDAVAPAALYIAAAWPKLQPHVRDAILTLIDASLAQTERAEADNG